MKKHQLNWKTWAVGSIILLLIIVTGNDYYRISQYKSFPIKPKHGLQTFESKVYYDLVKGEQPIEWSQLDNTLAFIENQYDCSDFRFVNLTRILYEFEDQIPSDYKSKIEKVIFNFRYWWDEPGENSMCYWSENHQILFASAEYLMGQKYPDVIFPNSKLSGKQHMEKAQVRILDWLNMRWQYGFTEFYSSVYYKEDVAALINLIDFSTNEEVRIKSQIVMDLLFYDVASQNCKGMFISASGRAYESNRKGGLDATLGGVTQYYWGNGQEIDPSLMYGLMVTKKYHLPAVLREIGLDSSSVVIKQSNGLEVQDLESEGFHTKNDHGMMMQWGMEAFVNPVIIRNSLAHIRQSNMFSNQFISDFKWLDFTVLRTLRLEPFLMKVMDSQFQGTAIQKGNTYTYKTKDYSLYTVQGYHPGEYADQHHISGMNIKNNFAIFHAHPAVSKTKETVSPSYWVGYGHLPHSVQSENVNLSIYNIPTNKGLMEMLIFQRANLIPQW